jgi:hypothetical protein
MPERKYKPLEPFCFNDDIWDLRLFYSNPLNQTINFETIQPSWYQLKVKQYRNYSGSLRKNRKLTRKNIS